MIIKYHDNNIPWIQDKKVENLMVMRQMNRGRGGRAGREELRKRGTKRGRERGRREGKQEKRGKRRLKGEEEGDNEIDKVKVE